MLVDLTEWELKVLQAETYGPEFAEKFTREAYEKRDALIKKISDAADNFDAYSVEPEAKMTWCDIKCKNVPINDKFGNAKKEKINVEKIDCPIEWLNNWTENHCKKLCKPRDYDSVLQNAIIRNFLSKDEVNFIIDCMLCASALSDASPDTYPGKADPVKELESKLRNLYPEVEK